MAGRKRPLAELLTLRYPHIEKKELLARILCGEVLVNGERIREPQRLVGRDAAICFQPSKPFVSRSGEKLAAALTAWHDIRQIDVQGLTMIDAGSSTGGFTDCLLQRGARRVYAVDVGYNQLDYGLRRDERVVVLERTNLFSLNRRRFLPEWPPEAAVADLSFRSLRRAAAHLLGLVSKGWLIALIKPQFEWPQPREGFRGIVPREELPGILKALVEDLWQEGTYTTELMASPIRGKRGNQEFLALLTVEQRCSRDAVLARLEALFK